MDTKALSTNEILDMLDEIDMNEYPLYADLFSNDSRKSVQKIGQRLLKQFRKNEHEKARVEIMKKHEYDLYSAGCLRVAGVDEVGRGPLAGPVVAAAVILPKDFCVLGINDSKQLSEKKREQLILQIERHAVDIGLGVVDEKIIDEINILNATKLAMKKAVQSFKHMPDHLLIDALTLEHIDVKQTAIIKGDQKSISIAAASIVAKVTRDRMMCQYHKKYPEYDFLGNKGYGTKKHYEGLRSSGLCPIHRRSFLKDFVK